MSESKKTMTAIRRFGSVGRGAPAPLMREWIHAMLYDPHEGYFAKAEHPVAPMTEPIPFKTLSSRSEYLKYVAAQYKTLGNKWLTPSEIFSPWMGRAIANHIASLGVRRVIEIGGGSGTLAVDIINFLKQPHVYDRDFSYTSIEISKTLSETQQRRLNAAGHGDVYFSRVADATKESTWEKDADFETPVLVLGMEVLDNLPHDKVVRVDGIWHQTRINTDRSEEVLEPVTDDELICRTLDAYESMQENQSATRDTIFRWLLDRTGTPDPVWLPTGAMSLLAALRHIPNHDILLGDFDYLPNVVVAGENAPIVSNTVDGRARDRGELLSAAFGSVDIFFPTNFRLLSAMYKSVHLTGTSKVEKAGHWLERALPDGLDSITCLDGACPLVEDYKNTSFARFSTLSGKN